MRTERSRSPVEALLSLAPTKVRRTLAGTEHSKNYQPLLDRHDDTPPLRTCDNIERNRSISIKQKSAFRHIVNSAADHIEVYKKDEHRNDKASSRYDDENNRILSHDEKQLENKRQDIGKFIYNIFGGSSRQEQKKTRFSTVDVKTYQRDPKYDKYLYYTKSELSEFSKQRYEDAANLRKDRLFAGGRKKDLSPTLLSLIFDPDDDIYTSASSRGIEQYVYPELKSEINRKQKQVRSKVLKYVRSQPYDPDGSKLRQLSEHYTRWARELAVEKAKCYAQNNALFLPKEM